MTSAQMRSNGSKQQCMHRSVFEFVENVRADGSMAHLTTAFCWFTLRHAFCVHLKLRSKLSTDKETNTNSMKWKLDPQKDQVFKAKRSTSSVSIVLWLLGKMCQCWKIRMQGTKDKWVSVSHCTSQCPLAVVLLREGCKKYCHFK